MNHASATFLGIVCGIIGIEWRIRLNEILDVSISGCGMDAKQYGHLLKIFFHYSWQDFHSFNICNVLFHPSVQQSN